MITLKRKVICPQKYKRVRALLNDARDVIRNAEGLDVEYVISHEYPGTPEVYTDDEGTVRITRKWFQRAISNKATAEGFDGAVFIFSEDSARKWNDLASGLRGSTLKDGDFFDEMWIRSDEETRDRDGYRITRTLAHEEGHAIEHRGITVLKVHDFDYDREGDLERFYSFVDATGYDKERDRRRGVQKAIIGVAEWVISLLKKKVTLPEEKSLHAAALAAIGTDASPSDLAPDELGCAETVSNIIKKVLPDFPVITGTWTLWDRLSKNSRFAQVEEPQAGDVIISPTGTVANAPFPGHVGIVDTYGRIMSNTSADGTFERNYDLKSWRTRYAQRGGYPVYYYRLTQ